MLVAIWILAALALALWWLLAWGAATVLGLDPSWVGGLHPKVENMPGSAWLNIWVPETMRIGDRYAIARFERPIRDTTIFSRPIIGNLLRRGLDCP